MDIYFLLVLKLKLKIEVEMVFTTEAACQLGGAVQLLVMMSTFVLSKSI